MKVYQILAAFETLLLPSRCVLCGGPGDRARLDLCSACTADLPTLAGGCPRCGLPAHGGTCPACRDAPPPQARCHAAFRYEFPVTELLAALKYRGGLANARVLGRLLADSLRAHGLVGEVDVIVPLPLHPVRLQERGYNQAYELGRVVARELGVDLAPRVLRRSRASAPQVGLAREARRDNVRGAFVAVHDALRGRRVALLDDVVTTGSTVAAATEALLEQAGASGVDVWCVARASAPRDNEPVAGRMR